jgi:hypothetical protein
MEKKNGKRKKLIIFGSIALLIVVIAATGLGVYFKKDLQIYLNHNQRKISVQYTWQCKQSNITFKQIYSDPDQKDFKIELETDPEIEVTYEDKVIDSHIFMYSPEAYYRYKPTQVCVYRFKNPITLAYYYKGKLALRQQFTATLIDPFPSDDELVFTSYEFVNKPKTSLGYYLAKFDLGADQVLVKANENTDRTVDVHSGYGDNLVGGEVLR